MKNNGKRELTAGMGLLAAFAVWTVLIQYYDVQPAGPEGTEVGFATFNVWFPDNENRTKRITIMNRPKGLIILTRRGSLLPL